MYMTGSPPALARAAAIAAIPAAASGKVEILDVDDQKRIILLRPGNTESCYQHQRKQYPFHSVYF